MNNLEIETCTNQRLGVNLLSMFFDKFCLNFVDLFSFLNSLA